MRRLLTLALGSCVLCAVASGAARKSGASTTSKSSKPQKQESSGKQTRKRAVPERASFDFNKTPMRDAVFHIQRLTGLNIVLHRDLQNTNPVITLRVQNMRLGSALKWICELADARYVFVDGAIYIIPKSKVLAKQQTIMVDVRDLVSRPRDFPGPDITLCQGEQGQAMIGLEDAGGPGDEDLESDLVSLVERMLRGAGKDITAETRNGRLVITVPGEK